MSLTTSGSQRLRSECVIVTEPDEASLPESLTVLKAMLRVEHSADDDYLKQLMREAASQISERTGRQLLTATRRLLVSNWWSGTIELPFPKLESLTHVKYLDGSEAEQTLSGSKYTLFTTGIYARLLLKDGLPTLSDEAELPVMVTYSCGYGVDETDIPAGLRTPVRELVRCWYEAEDMNRFTINKPFPQHVDALLDRWMLRKFR